MNRNSSIPERLCFLLLCVSVDNLFTISFVLISYLITLINNYIVIRVYLFSDHIDQSGFWFILRVTKILPEKDMIICSILKRNFMLILLSTVRNMNFYDKENYKILLQKLQVKYDHIQLCKHVIISSMSDHFHSKMKQYKRQSIKRNFNP